MRPILPTKGGWVEKAALRVVCRSNAEAGTKRGTRSCKAQTRFLFRYIKDVLRVSCGSKPVFPGRSRCFESGRRVAFGCLLARTGTRTGLFDVDADWGRVAGSAAEPGEEPEQEQG